MTMRALAAMAAALLPAWAAAQTVTGLRVEPAQITAGESVRITVSFDVESAINCGVRLQFGDGKSGGFRIQRQEDVPLSVPREYKAAGEYKVAVEPGRVGAVLGCNGKAQSVMLKVAAAGAASADQKSVKHARAPKDAKPDPHCPEGWALMRRSVKKSGAYTCRAAPSTRPVKLECPADLNYFENRKKGYIGCRS